MCAILEVHAALGVFYRPKTTILKEDLSLTRFFIVAYVVLVYVKLYAIIIWIHYTNVSV